MQYVAIAIIKVIKDNKPAYLLISPKKDFGKYTGYYYPPGGHIDQGETEQEALIRELKEELNLNISPITKIAETKADIKDQVTYWWECKAQSTDIKIQESEIANYGYFTENDMKNLKIWPETVSFFKNYIFQNKDIVNEENSNST